MTLEVFEYFCSWLLGYRYFHYRQLSASLSDTCIEVCTLIAYHFSPCSSWLSFLPFHYVYFRFLYYCFPYDIAFLRWDLFWTKTRFLEKTLKTKLRYPFQYENKSADDFLYPSSSHSTDCHTDDHFFLYTHTYTFFRVVGLIVLRANLKELRACSANV